MVALDGKESVEEWQQRVKTLQAACEEFRAVAENALTQARKSQEAADLVPKLLEELVAANELYAEMAIENAELKVEIHKAQLNYDKIERTLDYTEQTYQEACFQLANRSARISASHALVTARNSAILSSNVQLRENEYRYRQLVDPSPVAIFVHCEGVTVFANAAACKLFATSSSEDFIGKPAMNLIHPEFRESTQQRIRQVTENQEEVPTRECRFVRFDGTDFRAEVVGIPYTHEGKPAAQVFVYDITKRDRMERELVEGEKLIRNITDAVPALIYHIDSDQRFRFVNQTFLEWFNTSRDKVIGRNVRSVMGAKVYKISRPYMERALSGEPVTFDGVVTYRTKGERHMQVTYFPSVDPFGKVNGYTSHVNDITEFKQIEAALKESEKDFRQLAENIREVFWLMDFKENRCLYLSPAYEEVWGRSRESVYANRLSFIEGIHPEDRDGAMKNFTDNFGATGEYEYRVVRPDGSIRWILDRWFPIKDQDGSVYRCAGIAEDVTRFRSPETRRIET